VGVSILWDRNLISKRGTADWPKIKIEDQMLLDGERLCDFNCTVQLNGMSLRVIE
jgi:hypothetical protein